MLEDSGDNLRFVATFICHRHNNIRGEEGPHEAPVVVGLKGGQFDTRVSCPICGRVYILQYDGSTPLYFYSDRELELLKIEKKVWHPRW